MSDDLPRSQITKKCLLTPYVGTIGNIGIHDKKGKFHLGSNVGKIELFNETQTNIKEEFLRFYFMSRFGYKELTKHKKATAQESISIDAIRDCNVPLPPIKEQMRIVECLDYWFSFVRTIDESSLEISNLCGIIKHQILALAISGQLVPQDPADEPAADLLKRVNPNAVVSTDTSHYGQLPDGWCYTTMNFICQLYDGEKIEDKELINLDAKYLRGKSEGNTLNKGRFVPEKTTMILVDGENSGEIFTAPINGYQGSTFKLLDINKEMNAEYVKMIIRIYQKRLRDNKVGSAIPHLNKKMFREILVPVPPIAEQTRIVGRTNELMSKITELSEAL